MFFLIIHYLSTSANCFVFLCARHFPPFKKAKIEMTEFRDTDRNSGNDLLGSNQPYVCGSEGSVNPKMHKNIDIKLKKTLKQLHSIRILMMCE